jgi:uncharacterized protein YecT (DUF1311 family)
MKSRSIVAVSVVLTIAATTLFAWAQSSAKPQVSRDEWQINIDQPIQQLEQVLKSTEQQQPANYTISTLGFLYDAKLYIVFHKYLERLSPEKQAETRKEQERWLAHRKKAIADAYAEFAGGSLASYKAGAASIEITTARIAEFESRLRQVPDTSNRQQAPSDNKATAVQISLDRVPVKDGERIVSFRIAVTGGTVTKVTNIPPDWTLSLDSDLSWQPVLSGTCQHGASSGLSGGALPVAVVDASASDPTSPPLKVEATIGVTTDWKTVVNRPVSMKDLVRPYHGA